jgi:hypothetical protein
MLTLYELTEGTDVLTTAVEDVEVDGLMMSTKSADGSTGIVTADTRMSDVSEITPTVLFVEESGSEDPSKDALTTPELTDGPYSLSNMVVNASPDPLLTPIITEDTDVLETVVMVPEADGPMMSIGLEETHVQPNNATNTSDTGTWPTTRDETSTLTTLATTQLTDK